MFYLNKEVTWHVDPNWLAFTFRLSSACTWDCLVEIHFLQIFYKGQLKFSVLLNVPILELICRILWGREHQGWTQPKWLSLLGWASLLEHFWLDIFLTLILLLRRSLELYILPQMGILTVYRKHSCIMQLAPVTKAAIFAHPLPQLLYWCRFFSKTLLNFQGYLGNLKMQISIKRDFENCLSRFSAYPAPDLSRS